MNLPRLLSSLQAYTAPLGASVLLIIVATLVNLVAPERRRELRRAVVLYVIYLLSAAIELGLAQTHLTDALRAVDVVNELMLAFLVVHLAAIVLLDVVLRRAGVAGIVSDIGIGFAYAIAGGLVLSNAGFDPTGVVAASTLVAAILTVSLQSTLGNVVGGAALQLDGSIEVGDWVRLENGRQGQVRQIRWRHTVIETTEGGTLVVPNATLLSGQILLLGKHEGGPRQHRYSVAFHVDFRYAPGLVTDVVQEGLRGSPIPNVSTSPAPDCLCADFSRDGRDSYGYYVARYWLTDLQADELTASAVRTRVYAALKRAGIPLARPALMVFHAPRQEDHSEHESAARRARALAALRRVDLFHTLTPEELERTADRLLLTPFAAGEVMTRQGAVAHWLYVLVAGEAEVRVQTEGNSNTVATIVGPSVFGEMGLLTGEPRGASVVATSPCECYRLDKESFAQVLQERPALAADFSTLLAHRHAELRTIVEGLDARATAAVEARERDQILHRVRDFFGLAP